MSEDGGGAPSEVADEVMDIEDDSTHLSVFVSVAKGEQENLKWPFVGYINITLLNQLENENHYSRFLTFGSEEKDTGRGLRVRCLSHYISHSALTRGPDRITQYLKDNTLHFKVAVNVESDSK